MAGQEFKIFDTHVHYLLNTPLDVSVEIFRRMFELEGVDKALFLSVPHEPTFKELDILQNLKALYFKHVFSPNGYASAGLLHYPEWDEEAQSKEFLRQAIEYVDAGFDGMKMLEGKPTMRRGCPFKLSDKVYDRYFSFLEEVGMPITVHNGDRSVYWDRTKVTPANIARGWCYDDPSYPTKREVMDDLLTLMKKHPKLRLTAAHFGCSTEDMEDGKAFLDGFEFTAWDATPGNYNDINGERERWIPFLESHIDRIKYGTDSENEPTEKDMMIHLGSRPNLVQKFFGSDEEIRYCGEIYHGINLSEEAVRKIFRENAEKEYGEPKPINMEYVTKELERLEAACRENERAKAEHAFMKQYFGM